MAKQLTLTREQQQQYGQRVNEELDRLIMSWDGDLKQWYSTAIHALNFANPLDLKIPQKRFIELFNTTPQGLNMNVVMVLCNNLEARTPFEMNVTARDWADTLMLNQRIAERWTELAKPAEKKVLKEFEIMYGAPKIVTMGQA